MKYVVEFGNRGGAYVESLVVPSWAIADQIARGLVAAFENNPNAVGARHSDWVMPKGIVRATWASQTHFVAVSKLDGVPRGPASRHLWKKEACLFENTVMLRGAGDWLI